MAVIRRADWGAGAHRASTIPAPVSKLVLHHTVTPAWTGADAARRIRDIARSRGFADISYSWLVDVAGNEIEGRGWRRQGAHTQGHNSTAHAICLIGNYDANQPPAAMLNAAARLARKHGQGGHGPGRITHGHRDLGTTACPGRHAYAKIAEINRLAQASQPTPPEDDMPTAEEIAEAVWARKVPGGSLEGKTMNWLLQRAERAFDARDVSQENRALIREVAAAVRSGQPLDENKVAAALSQAMLPALGDIIRDVAADMPVDEDAMAALVVDKMSTRLASVAP